MLLPNVDVFCTGCGSATVYYLDEDPEDRFGTGPNPNVRTGPLGAFVVPDAAVSQYAADDLSADPWDLDPILVVPIRREAMIIQFIGR